MMTRLSIVAVFALFAAASAAPADDKKNEGPDKKSGTVTGTLTAKDKNWIEVKADGEEKARRYVPHWKGGLPKDGGGPDKEMVAVIKKTALKSRVRLEWVFEERPRVVKLEVLKSSTPEKK